GFRVRRVARISYAAHLVAPDYRGLCGGPPGGRSATAELLPGARAGHRAAASAGGVAAGFRTNGSRSQTVPAPAAGPGAPGDRRGGGVPDGGGRRWLSC